MIDRNKTFEIFNYYPENLNIKSAKKVIHHCDDCGKQRQIEYRRSIKKFPYYCHSCLMKKEHNFFTGKHFTGEQNGNYVDGKTLIKHFCKYTGCQREICLDTAVYGDGFCKKHSKLGERNGRYIDGRTPIRNLIRNGIFGKQWCISVFKRDNFTCQVCKRKKEVSGHLNPHHIKNFSVILNEFLTFYSQFNPIEDKETLVRLAETWNDFWDLSNGITLCEECHLNEHLQDKG